MFNILVVDDDSAHRYALIRYLKDAIPDFNKVYEASDGQEALSFLRTNSIDAIFTDIKMPIKNGLELLMDIKKLNECHDVVLVSASNEFNYVKEGLVLGAFDYILKPFDKKTILEVATRLKNSIENKRNKQRIETVILDNFESMYLNKSVSKLVDLMHVNKENSLHYVDEIFETIYNLYEKDFVKLNNVIQVFINMIFSEIKVKYPWIHNYHCFQSEISMEEKQYCNKDTLVSKVIKIICDISQTICDLYLNQSDGIMKELCEYIAQNSDKRITLETAANKFNYSTDYLGKLFKSKTGENFNNYITNVKMERAKHLLSHHKFKNYEIAQTLGYKDSEYFCKLFTRYTGQSPQSYFDIYSKTLNLLKLFVINNAYEDIYGSTNKFIESIINRQAI